ncbi:hypothetical protein [Desulfogranum marinum]|uniref:hypothetical protein n=1 Tax=Desulfogranum marinum TaxID=453220 RepID=UPI0029C86650|nr:hypothetical protein [Desulfogranum marinum]
MNREVLPFTRFLSDSCLSYLLDRATPVSGVPGLAEIGSCTGLENDNSLQFVCELYQQTKNDLIHVLEQRDRDREFIDTETTKCLEKNKQQDINYLADTYATVIGLRDHQDRVVVGPVSDHYFRGKGAQVARIPRWLAPPHVTLFGPPDSAKLSINAMNAFYRQLKKEPEVISRLLAKSESRPKWGADDEDSKTPLRHDLMLASQNLTQCFDRSLTVVEQGREYTISQDKSSLPIKRIPGIALPSYFLFYQDNPIPLHVYDFALHLYHCWDNPKALVFYIPKLENEEEARYLRTLISTAESLIQDRHPQYELGTIRLMIVIENPRAIFRVNEIMDALAPYFAGASLGWHDYIAATARLFKEDHNYRIPVKSDPDIVIKYIKASHELLANVVGKRGGIKVGGMYGVLPDSVDITSDSFQVSIKGFIRDVVTQLKRDLNGFWVAHPDFVRVGMALMQAWNEYQQGDQASMDDLVRSLLQPKYHEEILRFVYGKDINGLDASCSNFPRALLAADLVESQQNPSNDEAEVRYNVFQSLQYITDWLTGNGCVALPAALEGQPVRIMDDLATAERSRWEVWHEVYHGRFGRRRLVEIAHEELQCIKKDQKGETKRVQVKWNAQTGKWYPVALRLILQMMTNSKPVEFATELLLPFTIGEIQASTDPWQEICKIDKEKFTLESDIEAYCLEFRKLVQ